jgi:hypothetical protein
MTEVSVGSIVEDFPTRAEVRELYRSAAEAPPLSEPPSTAELFASVYEAAVAGEDVIAAVARDDGRLVGFAYGHPWRWEEQRYPWADELRERLGAAAAKLDGTHSLGLLARAPGALYRGFGRTVLAAWLGAVDGASWLQTTDIDSPARRLYDSVGYTALGHGPDAPNGAPGLVLLRTGGAVRARPAPPVR